MNNASPLTAPQASTREPVHALRTAWVQAWAQRSPREQLLLGLGALVLALAGIWSLALAPAWRTWQEAPQRQARLDSQSQQMQQLQAQAKSLKQPSPITRTEALTWLENNLAELGPEARISLQGERASLSLSAAPAEALARWLSQARERAQALPVQAQLQHSTAAATPSRTSASSPKPVSAPPPAGQPDAGSPVLWRGTLLLRLP
jgi:general secretion pathway protein M